MLDVMDRLLPEAGIHQRYILGQSLDSLAQAVAITLFMNGVADDASPDAEALRAYLWALHHRSA